MTKDKSVKELIQDAVGRKKIDRKTWYRPREIAEMGLIKNSTGGDNVESNYNFILVQIRNGNLKARNYSEGTKIHYWLVSEDAIRAYHKGKKADAK